MARSRCVSMMSVYGPTVSSGEWATRATQSLLLLYYLVCQWLIPSARTRTSDVTVRCWSVWRTPSRLKRVPLPLAHVRVEALEGVETVGGVDGGEPGGALVRLHA